MTPGRIRLGTAASILAGIGLSVLSLAGTLLVLEGSFRALGIRGHYPAPRIDEVIPKPGHGRRQTRFGFIPHATIRTTYASDPRGYFGAGNRIDHVHNSAGWRDLEHERAKPPGTYRILGLGDSYLFGRGVRREDIVLTQLELLLAEPRPDSAIETINTAEPGSNTVMQRDLLKEAGIRFAPDLVLVFFVLNDVDKRPSGEVKPKIEFYTNYTTIYQRPDAFSATSNLWSWVRQRYLLSIRARRTIRESVADFGDESPPWQACQRALTSIDEIARGQGASTLVVIFPFFHDLDGDYPFQTIHATVRSFLERSGVPVLDLRRAFHAYRGPELWVHETDQHPNEIAHAIAARAIAAHLEENAQRFGLPPAVRGGGSVVDGR